MLWLGFADFVGVEKLLEGKGSDKVMFMRIIGDRESLL